MTAPDTSNADAELAARGTRLAALFLDTVLWLVALLLLVKLGVVELPTDPNSVTFSQAVLSATLGFAIFLALNGFILVSSGQTWGKRVLRIRIVDENGGPAGVKDLLGMRYGIPWLMTAIPFLGIVFAFADAAFIFKEQRRCLHDVIANTKVVKLQATA